MVFDIFDEVIEEFFGDGDGGVVGLGEGFVLGFVGFGIGGGGEEVGEGMEDFFGEVFGLGGGVEVEGGVDLGLGGGGGDGEGCGEEEGEDVVD